MPSTGPMRTGSGADRPRLAPHVRLVYDQARQRHVLLTPETVTLLNGTGATIGAWMWWLDCRIAWR